MNVHLNALERAGLIQRIRRIDPKRRRQLPTKYILAFEAGFEPPPAGVSLPPYPPPNLPISSEPSPELVDGNQPKKATEPSPISDASRLRLNGDEIEEEPVKEPVTIVSSEAEAELNRAFAEFWVVHPRPTQRDACRHLFREVLHAGEDPREIIAGARKYAKEQAGNKPMYVCQSDNWLKRRGWREAPASDDPSPSKPGDVGELWAGIVKAGGLFPASAQKPSLVRDMLDRGLVDEADLAKAGVRL